MPSKILPAGAPGAASMTAELLRQAVAISGLAVWHRDLATNVVTCNDEMVRLLGLLPRSPGPGARALAWRLCVRSSSAWAGMCR